MDGLLLPGSASVGPVDLFPTQVWSVGRRDSAHQSAHREQVRWHLGVPGASADLPVNQLELRVGTVGVAVSVRRSAGVVVDGVVRPGPVVLTSGTSFVSPTVAGELDFAVTVLQAEEFAYRSDALVPSGTTLVLQMRPETGTALARVAHALAWPCMSTRRRPLALGWSGRDVAERLAQLDSSASAGREDITVLGKHLLVLADKVQSCRLVDGRRADTVFPIWPPWRDEGGEGETRDQRAERRNRCVADVLWRAGAVDARVIDTA